MAVEINTAFADELSGNTRVTFIPQQTQGLASATHGDATDQDVDKKQR